VPLERLFDQSDVAKEPKLIPDGDEVEEFNIGTATQPKIIRLSKSLPPETRQRYIDLMKEYVDIFSWDYNDLKAYDTSIIQHTIPLRENEKPFKQKLRRINPKLLPMIEKEVRKLFNMKIIVSLQFLKCVANPVLVRKKNGEIRLCINFRNLNRVSLKDNYLLPKMEHILQRVVGSQRMSMLDDFLGYN